MTMSLYIVVSLGLALALAGLALALLQGRRKPTHPVLWVIALIALGIDGALHVAWSVASVATGGVEGGWMVIGSTAIAVVLLTAVIAPGIAGWTLAASGVLLPFALVAADEIVADSSTPEISVGLMLAVYSSRAIVVGILLILSASERGASSTTTPGGSAATTEGSTAGLTGTPEPRHR